MGGPNSASRERATSHDFRRCSSLPFPHSSSRPLTPSPRLGQPQQPGKAERRHGGPRDNTNSGRTTRRAKRHHQWPKDVTAGWNEGRAGETTTQQAKPRHRGLNDSTSGRRTTPRVDHHDAKGGTTIPRARKGATTSPEAQRQHEQPNDDPNDRTTSEPSDTATATRRAPRRYPAPNNNAKGPAAECAGATTSEQPDDETAGPAT